MDKNKILILKRLFLIISSSLISAIGVNAFFVPHELLSGGVGGIALIIQYLTKIPAGYSIMFINIPLFIFSIKKIDKEFTILTIIGTFAQSMFLIITKNISDYFYVKDILLSCIYGGVLNGLAVGIIFSNHGSLGGADIISLYMRKKHDIDIGVMTFGINFIIITIGSVFFGLDIGLYTLISIYVVSFVIDKVINGFNRKKLLFIVSEKEEGITRKIKEELNRSSTMIFAEGAYTKHNIKIIYCVVPLAQVPKVKHIVDLIDPYALVSILDTSEVQGKGFKNFL